ncbi:sigma factor-like helix-turn-helix DNA-binding protein [Nonomuraea bangladeshensis]|uniref:sigma factor-like helix-turn-helix DNA-binding protein n=1 Tax=Nonomuraea bangladeshensis TaxID=404385 RepID=UPI0031D63F36
MSEYEPGAPVELSPRERAVLVLRLLSDEPMSRKELAALLGISVDRLRQVESKLMSKLRWGLRVEFPALDEDEAARRVRPRRLEE